MARYKDLTGTRYTRLVVIELCGKTKNGMNIWRCLCDCGNEVKVPTNELNNGHTKSCGCYAKDMNRQRMTTHGFRSTQLYKVWAGMKDRTNPNNHHNKGNYKKFNITMCNEWRNDFMSFYRWSMAHGYKEEKLPNGKNKWTIDRIDNTKGYFPDNCRWITNKEQMNNQTTNKKITYQGRTQNLSQWCEELNLPYSTILFRLNNGYDVERAFTDSLDHQNYYEYNGEKLNINQICEVTGLTKTNVWNRIHRGWDMQRLMTQKPRIVRRKNNV